MKNLFPLILMALLVNVCYAERYRASDDKLLKLQISELGPTRITFANQKISDVFFYPEEAAKVVLHQSGSLFVMRNKEQPHVYVTVMGEDGSTQDLRLRFVFMQPKPIKLISNPTTKQEKNNGTYHKKRE